MLTTENPGCIKYGKCRVACPIIKEGDTFTSTNTRKTYKISGTCAKCGWQYVGQSQTPFKVRHSNHKQEIKRKYGGLGQHYGGNGCGYNSVSIQIIDQVEVGDTRALEEQEIYWQNQLRCYVQNGGSSHCRRKEKKKLAQP